MCGVSTWVVQGPNGDEGVVLDTDPLETKLDLAGEVERETYRHPTMARIGGYRLHDPEFHHGWHAEDARELDLREGWQWYATPLSLPESELRETTIYGEHLYTCTAVSLQAVIAKATNIALEGDAAGDPVAKARGSKVRFRLQPEFEPGLGALREESPQIPATDSTQPAADRSQLLLF
jgi:hypothetical protein